MHQATDFDADWSEEQLLPSHLMMPAARHTLMPAARHTVGISMSRVSSYPQPLGLLPSAPFQCPLSTGGPVLLTTQRWWSCGRAGCPLVACTAPTSLSVATRPAHNVRASMLGSRSPPSPPNSSSQQHPATASLDPKSNSCTLTGLSLCKKQKVFAMWMWHQPV